ncbi:MAG: protein kinase [Candidatus Eisenbacteria bacterium]
MTDRTEDIFNDALELHGDERRRLLDERCAGNDTLRTEVESLLRMYEESDALSLTPAATHDTVPEQIGPYPVLGELGRGSMGIVYRARDERLGRELALKVLPANLAAVSGWTSRFEREARILASLNHPNLATIYSLEHAGGLRFLTMELVEGPTLAERLSEARKSGVPLSTESSLAVAREIAIALEAAHGQGVIHRDLKPYNIKITPSGTIKLLDFGIAKSLADLGIEEAHTDGIEHRPVGSSLLAGTPGYMSPEQRRGEAVDHRADIFAFGRILLECLSGQPPDVDEPIDGGDDSERIAAVATKIPPGLIQVLAACTSPDVSARPDSVRTVRASIESALDSFSETETVGGRGRIWVGLAVTVVSVLAVGAWAVLHSGREVKAPGPLRQTQVTFTGVASHPEISADGRRLAYVNEIFPTRNEIVVTDLQDRSARVVFETASVPTIRWSPDGRSLLVAGHAGTEATRRTYILPIGEDITSAGAASLVSVEMATQSFNRMAPIAWSPDGRSFAALEAHGARDTILIDSIESPDDTSRETPATPAVLPAPDGSIIIAIDWSPLGNRLGVVTSAGDERTVWTMATDGTDARALHHGRDITAMRWGLDGDFLYFVEGSDLVGFEIDPRNGTRRSDPTPILPGMSGDFSVAPNRIVYGVGPAQSNLRLLDLSTDPPRDRPFTTGSLSHGVARFSPDGRLLAFTRKAQTRSSELLVESLDGSVSRKLYQAGGFEVPAWSPDGSEIAIVSVTDGSWQLTTIDIQSGLVDTLPVPQSGGMIAWAPGTEILIQSRDANAYYEYARATHEITPLFPEPQRHYLWQMEVSPDGRSVAVLETESDGLSGPRVLLVDLESRASRTLYEGLATPCGWSQDGEWVYLVTRVGVEEPAPETSPALVGPEGRIGVIRVHTTDGEEQPVATLSRRGGMWSAVDVSQDERWIVYDAEELISDIWMAEGPLP